MAITVEMRTQVSQLYVGLFGRAPDGEGLGYWVNELGTGRSIVDVANTMYATAPARTLYPAYLTNQEIIGNFYTNVLGRTADNEGLNYWTGKLNGATPGSVIAEMINVVANYSGSDPAGLTSAALFNNKVEVAQWYGETIGDLAGATTILANVTEDPTSIEAAKTGGAVQSGQTFTLTNGADAFNGNAGADILRGVAGAAIGQQDQTTLNSSDVLDGAAGEDSLVVLLNGNYGGGATIKNIETLQIGQNVGGVTNFDYNVNNGVYEVTSVNTVVYDQITAGETLNVNNVTPSATGTVIPTLKWDNEAGSTAGTAGVTFREASIAGATTQLNIVLDDVNTGVFNIAAGVETVKITSQGSTANTLANSTAYDDNGANQNVDLLSGVGTATNDDNSLTKVIIDGAQVFGKAAGVVATAGATQGLTDRTVGVDTGFDAAATQSNLISVAATVTEVDASASTGGVNVRFTPRVNGAEVAQVFKGGDGADYVEFEVGNVNATGGKGNDTFAFVNAGFNSTLTVADSLAGGEGSDTLQIGVNGAASAGQQTYTLDWTEFNNKTGIDTLDLRGNVNTVTLSDSFVAASDAGLAVRTDKIVQTSATDSANPATSTARQEDNSVNTINLTKLSAGRAITVEGGSGSDRVVANEQSLTASTVVRGGTNVGNNGAAAVAGDYDTITVVDNAVLSRGDLSNITGVEAVALVKSDNTSGRQFSLEITQTFLTNNALATDVAAGTSTLTDTVFSVVTGAAANANSLTAGDTVTIDVSDLYTNGVVAGGLKAGIGARTIDVSSLAAAGVTIVIRDTTGVIAAPAVVTGVGAVAASADAIISLGSAALNVGGGALVFQGTAADESFTLTAATDSASMGAGTDTTNVSAGLVLTGTLDGGTGTDTLSLGAAANISGATVSNYETLTLNGAATMTAAQYNAFTTINAAGGADAVTLTTTANVTGVAAVETYNLSATGNQITLAGATAQAINGNAAAVNDTVVTTGANAANKTIALGAGTADTLTFTTTFAADWTLAAAGAAGSAVTGVEVVNLQAGLVNGASGLTMFNGAATVNLTSAAGQAGELILGTGGQTVVVTGNTSGAYTVTGNTGADSVDLTNVGAAGGAITFGTAGLITALDTITGFRAGTDKIDTATGNTGALTALNIATANTADFAAAVATAINANAAGTAANYNAAGDAYMITVAAGTAAGTYLVVNEGVTNAVFTATEDVVLKLVGTVGVITAADII